MLAIRSAPRDDNGISPAEMVYGSVLALPSAFLDTRSPPAADFIQRLRFAAASVPSVPTRSADVAVDAWVDVALRVCSHVWVRRDAHVKPLEPLYDGPFLVLGRTEKVFQLQMGTRQVAVSVDRLKPVRSEVEVEVQQPRPRGRPPRPHRPDQPPRPRGRPPHPRRPDRPPRPRGRPRRARPASPEPVSQTAADSAVLGGGYAAPRRAPVRAVRLHPRNVKCCMCVRY